MFSENSWITPRQQRRILMGEWIGKAFLLFPFYCLTMQNQTAFGSFLFGAALSWLLTEILLDRKVEGVLQRSFWLLYLFGYLLLALGGAAALIKQCFLPDASDRILVLLLLLCGVKTVGDLETRGRMSEILTPLMVGVIAVLLLFALAKTSEAGGSAEEYFGIQGHFSLRAFLGGVFLFLDPCSWKSNRISWKPDRKSIRQGMALILFGVCAAMAVCLWKLGAVRLFVLKWPLITVASGIEILGGKGGRIAALLLLISLLFAMSGIWFGIASLLQPLLEQKKSFRLLKIAGDGMIVLLVVFWLAGETGGQEIEEQDYVSALEITWDQQWVCKALTYNETESGAKLLSGKGDRLWEALEEMNQKEACELNLDHLKLLLWKTPIANIPDRTMKFLFADLENQLCLSELTAVVEEEAITLEAWKEENVSSVLKKQKHYQYLKDWLKEKMFKTFV